MLGYIRESVQGWIAWAIVILLIIPFALWGINQYFGNNGSLVVASVNGEEITQQAFQREYYLQRDRMRQMLGEQFNPVSSKTRSKTKRWKT
jgi:peptidyl-prolyl cis-trans isomerase D